MTCDGDGANGWKDWRGVDFTRAPGDPGNREICEAGGRAGGRGHKVVELEERQQVDINFRGDSIEHARNTAGRTHGRVGG